MASSFAVSVDQYPLLRQFTYEPIIHIKNKRESSQEWDAMRLADKTILIPAAGLGIGCVGALACVTKGARVIATDRDLLQGLDMECHRIDDHFLDSCVIRVVPDRPGLSIKMKPASLQTHFYRE